MSDPILTDDASRLSLLPIRYPTLWAFYKKAEASFWPAASIDLASDYDGWLQLTPDERAFFSHVLAFFSVSDALVNENLCARFATDVKAPEARSFYHLQMGVEAVHTEVYATLLDHLVREPGERAVYLNAVRELPTVRSKALFCERWTASTRPFAERLVAFACMEGILFSGSFAAIYWLRTRGLCPGLCESNTYIARDEGLHRDFAVALHALLLDKCPEETARTIVRKAVDIERVFMDAALPRNIRGLSASDMCTYIEFVADHLLRALGFEPLYGSANPLAFMETIGLQGKSNFFEQRPTEYSLSATRADPAAGQFSTDEAF